MLLKHTLSAPGRQEYFLNPASLDLRDALPISRRRSASMPLGESSITSPWAVCDVDDQIDGCRSRRRRPRS